MEASSTVSAGLYAVERHVLENDQLAEGGYVRIERFRYRERHPVGAHGNSIFESLLYYKTGKTGAAALGSRRSTASSSVTRGAVRVAGRPCGGALFSVFLPQ